MVEPGHYEDSSGTVYAAKQSGKPPVWHLTRLIRFDGHCHDERPFPREDFPRCVERGTFKFIPPQS